MAHLHRLIAGLLLLVCAGVASASFPVQTLYWYKWNGHVGPQATSLQAACLLQGTSDLAALEAVASGYTTGNAQWYTGTGGPKCVFYYKNSSGVFVPAVDGVADLGASCPVNSTGTSTCTCNTGYVDGTGSAAGSCVAPSDPCGALKGQDAGEFTHDSGYNDSTGGPLYGDFTACDSTNSVGSGLCQVSVSNPYCQLSGGGYYKCTGGGVYSGTKMASAANCVTAVPAKAPAGTTPVVPPTPPNNPDGTPPVADPSKAAPAPCPAGQAPGQVNGTTVCAPSGTDQPSTGGSGASVKNPDGSSSSTVNQTQCAAGGDKCVTDSTTCTQASGSSTQTCATTSTTQSLASTCAKDPGNSVCAGGDGTGVESSFSGTCASGFKAVSDDAVINAMAQEIYVQDCKVNPSQAVVTAGTNRLANTSQTADVTASSPNNSTVDMSLSGSFDSGNAGIVGACMPSTSISWMNKTVVIPWDTWCSSLQVLGNVMYWAAYVVAAIIIFV